MREIYISHRISSYQKQQFPHVMWPIAHNHYRALIQVPIENTDTIIAHVEPSTNHTALEAYCTMKTKTLQLDVVHIFS